MTLLMTQLRRLMTVDRRRSIDRRAAETAGMTTGDLSAPNGIE